MNKDRQNNSTINSLEDKSNNSDFSSSNELNNLKVKDIIMKSKLVICFKKYTNKIFNKINHFFSKLSILSQYLFFLIPLTFFLLFILIIIHFHAFERVLKIDLYCAVKDEYLKPIISDLDNILFDIGSLEIKNTYEDIENLFFFKIYFKELISMGLLNESEKIYPDISNTSETLYSTFDFILKQLGMSSIYTISKNDSELYIDNRKDSFSELGKLYYYMFPSISFEGYTRNIFINQSFLIAYEYDNNTKNVINNDFFFAFPSFDNEGKKTKNFIQDNTYIWPKISLEKNIHGEKYDNSFYKENWFIKQDYDFRVKANEIINIDFSIAHLNYNYYGNINKTTIFSIQNYEISNGKHYIINLIYFINQNILKEESFDYSTFLIFNNTKLIEKERYSDNNTYLIFKSNIIEISLSSILNKYFHYGIYDINNNFVKYGASFDGFDIEHFGEPLKYYITIKNFNIDLSLFSSLYLYTLLLMKSEYNISLNEKTEITQFEFENNYNLTQNICKEINFTSYKEYLLNEKMNCWNIQNLLYYSQKNIPKDKALYNYLNMPFCICLPLYCLNNNNKYENNTEFVNKIILPERCQNYLKYYKNKEEEEKEEIKKKIYEFGEVVNIFSSNLKSKLENEFYIYKYMKYSQIPGIYFLIINFVDNAIFDNILHIFLDKLSGFHFFFSIMITSNYLILIIIINNILIRNIKKISGVIFSFQKNHEYYLYQSNIDNDNTEEKKTEIGYINSFDKTDNIFNYSENRPLLQNVNDNYEKNANNEIYSIENPLLDELFKIFYKYYNISIENIIKKYSKSKKATTLKEKIHILEGKNELFKLLGILSLYAPKFKLNIHMNFNSYIKSKLNQNYLKFIKKNKSIQSSQILLTQSVIYELLSTENLEDYGLVTNINFKYITNINLNNKINNSIKKAIFRYKYNENKEKEEDILNNNNFMNKGQNIINTSKVLFKDDDNNSYTKIMYKEKNNLLTELENNFENDDYLKKDKLISSFDFFLLNVYYKYLKKIIYTSDCSQKQDNLE